MIARRGLDVDRCWCDRLRRMQSRSVFDALAADGRTSIRSASVYSRFAESGSGCGLHLLTSSLIRARAGMN